MRVVSRPTIFFCVSFCTSTVYIVDFYVDRLRRCITIRFLHKEWQNCTPISSFFFLYEYIHTMTVTKKVRNWHAQLCMCMILQYSTLWKLENFNYCLHHHLLFLDPSMSRTQRQKKHIPYRVHTVSVCTSTYQYSIAKNLKAMSPTPALTFF